MITRGINDKCVINVAIGMVQAASYNPILNDVTTPAARDGMRINSLVRQTGVPILSIDTYFQMAVSDMHLSANIDTGRRLKATIQGDFSPRFCAALRQYPGFEDIVSMDDVRILDMFVDYHRFPSEYFQNFLRPFISETGGLVGDLYHRQVVGGRVFFANIGEALELTHKNHITSRYKVSFAAADQNPLYIATSAIVELQIQNETEISKIINAPPFILLTKKNSSSSSDSSSSSQLSRKRKKS